MSDRQIRWIFVFFIWVGAIMAWSRPTVAQQEPAPPKGKVLVGLHRAQKPVNNKAHFHEVPWEHDLDVKKWKGKYTAVFLQEIKDAQKDDILQVHHHVMFNVRGAYDIRQPVAKKYPLACQLSVLVRVLNEMPKETVLDLVPSDTSALGSRRDRLGLWGTSYGVDAGTGGRFTDLTTKMGVTVGTPYLTDVGMNAFYVQQTPVIIAVWAFPESQGADKTVFAQIPDTSDYQELVVMQYR